MTAPASGPTAAPLPHQTRTLYRVLTSLRHGLHTLFLLLLAFGMVHSPTLPTVVVAVALGAFYALGAVGSNRSGFPTARAGWWWLAGVSAGWLALMFLGGEFMWLEFPLVFLYLRYLPRPVGSAAAVAAWAVAAFVPAWLSPGSWSIAGVLGPAIGTVFAGVMFFAYITLRDEVERYRAIAEELRRTQEDLARSENLAGRLSERERISREIHDTVAQGLSSIVLVSRAAQRASDPSSHLRTIQQVAQESLDQARRFVKELAPAAPDAAQNSAQEPAQETARDLAAALDALVRSMRERSRALGESTTYELVTDGDTARPLPAAAAETVERVAREGLNNAAKHAHASRVVVTLSIFDTEATVDVVDDGIGMHGAAGPDAFGLAGLRARVAEAGGELTIESAGATDAADAAADTAAADATGTILSARVPLTTASSGSEGDR